MMLPQGIKRIFYKAIEGGISLDDFEQWLYANKELEKCLNPDDYLDLISFNFKNAKHEVFSLLERHIDHGEFETEKMFGLLYEVQQKNERLPYVLMEFYELYCRGYDFLRDLGGYFGYLVESPLNMDADTWDELTTEQQKELLDAFSPELDECIEQAIAWLETKKIVLTGERDRIGDYDYKDFRTEEERKSRFC